MREPKAPITHVWLASFSTTMSRPSSWITGGDPMMHTLQQMGLKVHLGAGGNARQAAMAVNDSGPN
ncbi:MAG TPA: hypothetical protein VF984_15235 [Actinomycetota bacterium]